MREPRVASFLTTLCAPDTRLRTLRPEYNRLAEGAFFYVMADTLQDIFEPHGSYIVGPKTFRVQVSHESILRYMEQHYGNNVLYLPRDWNHTIFTAISLLQRLKAKLRVFKPKTADEALVKKLITYMVDPNRTMETALEMAKDDAIVADVLLNMDLTVFIGVTQSWMAL
jgi:hypothetical protein